MAENETFDYVIVGAGSAGCTLANRLSADPDISVLLLEVGPMDHDWAWKIHMPAALSQVLSDDTYNWYYEDFSGIGGNKRAKSCVASKLQRYARKL